MKKKNVIEIGGQEVKVKYCFATEVLFTQKSGRDFNAFMDEAGKVLAEGKMPEAKKIVTLLSAAIDSHYESVDEESPMTEKQILFNIESDELIQAFLHLLEMKAAFYHVPVTEPEDKKAEGDGKNA